LICRFLPYTTLTFVNDAYCKYFGKTADELLGTKFILFMPESEREPMLRHIQSIIRQQRSQTHEHPVIRSDRSPGWQQWTDCVISTGPNGRVELQGVGRDISDRKQLEQQLIQRERAFSTLVENSPDVICRLDRNLRYIYVSPNLKDVFGIASEVFPGKCPHDVLIPDFDFGEFESRCREAIEKGQATVHEFRYRRRHYRTRIIPEYSPQGEVESVLSISEDFTERLRAEIELRKLTTRLINLQDEERRRIARELHDGATQNIVAITLNLHRVERLTNNQVAEIDVLLNECRQLATESLTELRTLSYLLHPPILDQAGLVRAVQWFVRGFSERTGIVVDVGGVQDIGRLTPEIETTLFRILQESLTNVLRHSGSDSASVRLEKANTEVRLQVLDRGHGMVDGAGEDGEIGVGISGMRQRLIQLGGRLEIVSSERGTTITAAVPLVARSNPSRRSATAS
jgi:PAS domain S-box-containing protein